MPCIFLLLLLLPISTILPMEKIPKDVFEYVLNPYLNRVKKDALICTNKYLSQQIVSQNSLNISYNVASQANNKQEMIKWQTKGSLPIHEEVYNLFIRNEQKLAEKVWKEHIYNSSTPFCIRSAFIHGTVMNNKNFITWMLEKANPPYNGYLISTTMILAKNHNYTEIIKALNDYVEKNKKSQQQDLCARYFFYTPDGRILYNRAIIPFQ